MKIIGTTKVGEGYHSRDAYVVIISKDELARVANKAGYREEQPNPKVGDDYPIDEGFDFRAQLTDAIHKMASAYEAFAKVAPVAAAFAGVVQRKSDGAA